MRALSVACVLVLLPFAAHAASCVPPKDFVDTPPPTIAAPAELVSHTEDIDITRPLATVLTIVNAMDLHRAIRNPTSLPGVAGTYVLTRGAFGPPGTRQMDCLTDGSTLVEKSLEREETPRLFHFRYVVWNYTTEKARPIAYAVGEFHFSAAAPNRTHIHWVYAFALRRDRFPGWLGGFGDFLFRITFLDRDYADLMRGTLQGYKTTAEASAGR